MSFRGLCGYAQSPWESTSKKDIPDCHGCDATFTSEISINKEEYEYLKSLVDNYGEKTK